MADFRTKFFTLASVATMFAGMAHAQLNGPGAACTASSGAVFVAAEGTTEQVADVVISCPANAAAATLNISVYLSPAVSITSATLGSGGSARSEAMAGITASYTVGGATNASVVAGSISGSSITFNGITVPINAAPTTFTITNIKINASQVATTSGAPTAVTETIFLGGTNVTPGVLSAVNVAFATNALSGVKTSPLTGSSIASIQICSGSQAWGGSAAAGGFNLQFSEGFATAFKTGGTAAGNAALGSEFNPNNTYTGYGVTAPAANTATSGTRIQITFNNVPAGVTVYVPLTANVVNPAAPPPNLSTITLTSSATGAFSAVVGSTANGAPGATAGNKPGDGSYAAVTLANGSGTVVYEETLNSAGTVEAYTLPIYLSAGAAGVTAPSSAITTTVSLAPIGSSSSVPNFVSGSSTATANGAAFSACTTTLLFPFVTNQLGFDTGVAIANTSTDILKDGVSKSQAAAQSGTCQLSFFGNTAPAAVTTANIASGTDYAAAASTVAPGFQGYMIANCNFLYAHGFAYVVYNLTQNNGAAMGYLANVIEGDRKSVVVETGGVGTTNPESSGQ